MNYDYKSLLYGAFLAINRCSKIIKESPDYGYNSSIIKEFEKIKKQIEETHKGNNR